MTDRVCTRNRIFGYWPESTEIMSWKQVEQGQIFSKFPTLKNHQICQKIWQKMKKSLVQLSLNKFLYVASSKTRYPGFGYVCDPSLVLYPGYNSNRDSDSKSHGFVSLSLSLMSAKMHKVLVGQIMCREFFFCKF